jgi:hypothetical protein
MSAIIWILLGLGAAPHKANKTIHFFCDSSSVLVNQREFGRLDAQLLKAITEGLERDIVKTRYFATFGDLGPF